MRDRQNILALTLAAGLALVTAATAQAQTTPGRQVDPAVVSAYVAKTWPKVPDGWASRVTQDETQRICSEHRNALPNDLFATVQARETQSVVFPADGQLMGDWKRGYAIAQSGRGGQFSDGPNTVNGGNCYACHQLSPSEVSYGTLGPSLTNYGKDRNFEPEALRAAYAKVYNAQSAFPCSNMPRFGVNGFLNEQQIKDVVAYLFHPDSPVNK